MLQITNSHSISLELDDDTKIAVERTNPLFTDASQFFQDVTYPGKAALSPVNKRFISSGHLVEAYNDVYELEVSVDYGGHLMFSGLMRYKILDREISFLLLVNWGKVADIAKNTRLTDFDFGDANISLRWHVPPDALASITNPDDYNFAYFPVLHRDTEVGDGSSTVKADFFANPWSYEDQEFVPWVPPIPIPTDVAWQRRWAPHFKLKYVLQRTLEFLGFAQYGTIWDDPDFDKLYIHSELDLRLYRQSANNYLPGITIADFLTQLKDRLQLSFFFDSSNKRVNVSSYASQIAQEDTQDLTPYITEINEISTAEKKGYSITLKPFDNDEMFSSEGGKPTTAYKLLVGHGENKVELPISTLHQKQEPEGYTYPVSGVERRSLAGDGPSRKTGQDAANPWPMRLLRYEGMKLVEPGKYWPEAMTYDLSMEHASFYRFLNDSKLVKVKGFLPVSRLAQLEATRKIGIISQEGTFAYAMPVTINYNLGIKRADRAEFEIIARTIVRDSKTTAVVEPVRPDFDIQGEMITPVKFVFDEDLYERIEFEAYHATILNPMDRPARVSGEITQSARPPYYAGGSIAYISTGADEPGSYRMSIVLANTYPIPDPPYFGGEVLSPFVADGAYWRFTTTVHLLPDSPAPLIITIP